MSPAIGVESLVKPALFLGGRAVDYVVETLRNGGLGTRHLPSNRVVPHVLAAVGRAGLAQALSTGSGALAIANPVLLGASLGVGLLNLGVGAWTAWQVRHLRREARERDERAQAQLAGLHRLVEDSADQLARQVRDTSRLLDVIAARQDLLDASLTERHRDLTTWLAHAHAELVASTKQRESYELDAQLAVLLKHHGVVRHALTSEREPPRLDLEAIVASAVQLAAWIDVRLRDLEVGEAKRMPLLAARAIGLRLELDARAILEAEPDARSAEAARLRELVAREIRALVDRAPIWTLARRDSALLEQYIYLHRALGAQGTLVELVDGEIVTLLPTRLLDWDDGLAPVRELTPRREPRDSSEVLRLQMLAEHKAWSQISKHLAGDESEIPRAALAEHLGLGPEEQLDDEALRALLRAAPLEPLRRRVDIELGGRA